MSWKPSGDGEAPPDYMAALYGDDTEDSEQEDVEFLEEESSEEEELDAPDYSPLTSPERRMRDHSPEPYLMDDIAGLSQPQPSSSRSARYEIEHLADDDGRRSRSPLARRSASAEPEQQGVVLAVFGEDGAPLEVLEDPTLDLELDFVTPDSHALYESHDERMGESSPVVIVEGGAIERSVRGRSVRGRGGRGRRGRGGRARTCGSSSQGRGGRRRQAGWQPGQPLEEVWLTDDDVPFELREMARDVVMRRQARVEALEERRRNTRARRNQEEGDDSESEDDDVFEDAIDERDSALLEGEDLQFEWSPMETFQGVEETFTPERTGSVSSYANAYDAFRSFWDDSILQVIADETNRYASRISSASFQADWVPTNADEVMCLFAFWMMTGIIRMPTICSYFSTNSLLQTEVFSRITTLKRYTCLNRALHFVDTNPETDANPNANDAASSDRLYQLRPFVDHLNSKFKENYVLKKDICIDESLTLWKGRLNMRQYIRSKAAKFGIKTFELCESATGYLWSFLVYTGKDTTPEQPHGSKTTSIVLKLIEPLLNKGYRLFMDNWFNSPYLARYLKRRGTDCVGTLRASRVDVPTLVTRVPLRRGQIVARHSGDMSVLSWMDKKRITMISTCHGAATGLPRVSSRSSVSTTRPELFKPQSILDYNRSMGGVDLKDQMLEPYLLERKRGAKWYLKLFKRLLNVSIHNSRVLLESSLKMRQDNLKFRLELVHAILDHHHSLIPKGRRAAASHLRNHAFPHVLHHAHWLVHVPQGEADRARNRQTYKKCVVCLQEGRKTQRTSFMCQTCEVPLCVVNCYKKYHSPT